MSVRLRCLLPLYERTRVVLCAMQAGVKTQGRRRSDEGDERTWRR